MKITWFGGRTVRLHIAGQILVWHPEPIAGVASEELTSGADRVIGDESDLPKIDGEAWRPRRPPTAIEPAEQGVVVFRLGADAVMVDAPGEAPLLLLGGPPPGVGRWLRDAVVVAFDAHAAASALEALQPRLIALAIAGDAVDAAFAALCDRLGGTALSALEPGLALEV